MSKANVTKKIYNTECIIASVLFGIFCATNFVSAFVSTSISNNMAEQNMYSHFDNPILTLVGMGLFIVFGSLVYKLSKKDTAKFNRIFLILVLCEYVILGIVFVLFGRCIPTADQATVYWMGDSLSRGDISMISAESYLSYYPQQIGLMIFYSALIKLVNIFPDALASFHYVKVLYVIITTASVYILYLTIGELFNKERIKTIFLYLMMGNFYLIMYSNFLYGEIPGLFLISVSMYFVVRLLNGKGAFALNSAFAVVFASLSVFIRKNSLIYVIAALIILVVFAMYQKNWRYLLTGGLLLVCSVLIIPVTIRIFENRADNKLLKGVTTMSYIAMGMQEGGRASGWYNGFNYDTYEINGWDTEKANEISKESIKERLEVFKDNPSYAFGFYMDKYISQWTDGTYASAQATYTQYGRAKIFEKLYDGELYKYYVQYSNIYQSVIYLGTFVFCIFYCRDALIKKKYNLLVYFPMIFIFGGFLFHMMWEANSRYIFTYAVFLSLYAAAGYGYLADRILERFTKHGK